MTRLWYNKLFSQLWLLTLFRKWHFAQEWVLTVHHQACWPPPKWELVLRNQGDGQIWSIPTKRRVSWLISTKRRARCGETFSRRDSTREQAAIAARNSFSLCWWFSTNFFCSYEFLFQEGSANQPTNGGEDVAAAFTREVANFLWNFAFARKATKLIILLKVLILKVFLLIL